MLNYFRSVNAINNFMSTRQVAGVKVHNIVVKNELLMNIYIFNTLNIILSGEAFIDIARANSALPSGLHGEGVQFGLLEGEDRGFRAA